MQNVFSWGRYPKSKSSVVPLFWIDDAPTILQRNSAPFLAHGLGRSYGDCCLNDGGVLLSTRRLNRFIAFDKTNGHLKCEAGASLDEILRFCVPQGWFLPVTPGTKYVTVGGAIANDVHGKNHHRCGTFGRHVTRFALLRSDGNVYECSPNDHEELFKATIGGLGLTGLILWVEFKLRPIASPWMDTEFCIFRDLDAFYDLTQESDTTHEHTVAWIDCSARGKKLGRGIFIRGNHVETPLTRSAPSPPKSRTIPFDAPSWLLNRWSINAFNRLFYTSHRLKGRRRLVGHDAFFYPLDAIIDWNRLYGKRGFFQYQCVVPEKKGITEVIQAAQKGGLTSFLSVLKQFGDHPSPGLLSFPRPGLTLTMDIPYSPKVPKVLETLDEIVAHHGGALYPAKDAFMSARHFSTFYPHWEQLDSFRDPKLSSSFWRRVTAGS